MFSKTVIILDKIIRVSQRELKRQKLLQNKGSF